MNKREFDNFFRSYSQDVDNANRHGFWKLSDALILQIIKDNIPVGISEDKIILDAGGGTGRWVCDLSKIYKSKFILYDLSADMLKKAKCNIKNANIENRVRLIAGDIGNIEKVKTESIDYIVSIYSPISFIYQKMKALSEMFRILKSGGKIIIMGHGFFNAVASKINNFCASAKEIEMLDKEFMVKWNEHTPKLNVFSAETLESDLKKAGFIFEKAYGVPVFLQPGQEDFDPENIKKSRVSRALKEKSFFDEVFKMEMQYNSKPTIVNRGMNMLVVALKN